MRFKRLSDTGKMLIRKAMMAMALVVIGASRPAAGVGPAIVGAVYISKFAFAAVIAFAVAAVLLYNKTEKKHEKKDNRKDFQSLLINENIWKVRHRYKYLQPLGSGSYGEVCSAVDKETDFKVNIKKSLTPFETIDHAKRIHRELWILKCLKHENVICLVDAFTPDKTASDVKDIYFVFPMLDTDLSKLMAEHREFHDITINLIVHQILHGLYYLHSADIMHRDLKPNNIAINKNFSLKIINFGIARVQDIDSTPEVCYRAPEMILNSSRYDRSVDIWAVACIICQLITREPLFLKKPEREQINEFINFLGSPDNEFIDKIKSNIAKDFIRQLPKSQKKDFKKRFPKANPLVLDLMKKMLAWNPDNRISAEDALSHRYITNNNSGSTKREPISKPYDEYFGNRVLSIDEWKTEIFQELLNPTDKKNV